jgi:hypothetical protein
MISDADTYSLIAVLLKEERNTWVIRGCWVKENQTRKQEEESAFSVLPNSFPPPQAPTSRKYRNLTRTKRSGIWLCWGGQAITTSQLLPQVRKQSLVYTYPL